MSQMIRRTKNACSHKLESPITFQSVKQTKAPDSHSLKLQPKKKKNNVAIDFQLRNPRAKKTSNEISTFTILVLHLKNGNRLEQIECHDELVV